MEFLQAKKKNFIGIVSLVVVIVAAFSAVIFSNAQENYRVIKVVEVFGNVSVVVDGLEYEAYPGMNLQGNCSIVTSGNSYVRMVLDDDKFIKLESGSKIVFEELGPLHHGRTAIHLERGAILNEITKPLKIGESYVVHTPNAVLAVRGTFFRVDLRTTETGECLTDVLVYRGGVSSQRILPDGSLVEEDVHIDAGYKARISMDSENTVYVFDNGENIMVPIQDNEMPTEDESSHYQSIISLQTAQVTNVIDDSISSLGYVKKENMLVLGAPYDGGYAQSGNVPGEKDAVTLEESLPEDTSEIVDIVPESTANTDGGIESNTNESTNVENNIGANTEANTGANISATPETGTDTNIGASTETDTGINTETNNGTNADTGNSEENKETDSGTNENDSSSDSGGDSGNSGSTHSHIVINVGTEDVHTKCSSCGEILSTTHSYTESILQAATCTDVGEKEYGCSCGYSYTEEIAATGHTEVNGGTKDVHTKCETCGIPLSTVHSYTEKVLKEVTCTESGMKKTGCSCGYYTTTSLDPLGHSKATEDSVTTCVNCTERLVMIDATTFPDENFRNIILTSYDTVKDNMLTPEEYGSVSSMTVQNYGTSESLISSLEGIEYFENIGQLDCQGQTNLTSLDVSGLPMLTSLYVTNTGLTTLTITNNMYIQYLWANESTSLTSINVSGCTNLESFNVAYCTNLTSIDASNCTKLTSIDTTGCSASLNIIKTGSGMQ